MPEITDPALLARLNGDVTVSDGQKGIGSNESRTRESQFVTQPQLRAYARQLAEAQAFNQALPTGRWRMRVNSAQEELPSGWQNGDVANYQSMLGLQQALTKPIISLNNPPGTVTGSKEMDAVKEQEMAQSLIPGPGKERAANEYLINRAGNLILDKTAFNAFSNRWRTKFGSVYGKDARGRDANQAWADYQRSPAYKRTVMTPFTKLLANGGYAPRPKAAPAPKPAGQVKFLGFE